MILCGKECYPCCDFCVHALHEIIDDYDLQIIGGPIKCTRFNDQRHDDIAVTCGYCSEFHCSNAKWTKNWINISEEDWNNEYNKYLARPRRLS